MIDKKIAKQGMLHALLAAAYIVLVATVMSNIERILGKGPDTVMAPITALLMLTVSAAVMASLVFGKPVMWYIDGKKREALGLLGATIGSLAALTFLCLLAFAVINNL